jgi:hypothetical protein
MENTQKLRKHIYAALKEVTKASSPQIYQMIQHKEGYAHAEKRIIELSISEKLPVQAVIPHLENELSLT